jgi:hypothetical protein
MQESCHRCHGDLPSGEDLTAFCPHCSAPQLFLAESFLANQQPDQQPGQLPPDADTTGALPPPAPRQVDWQAALRCSALVAAIAAALSVLALRVPGLSLLSTVWILTASMSTLALYQRHRPLAWMDAGIGARIGLTAGLALVVLVAASMAVSGLVARFGLHAMAGFDAALVQLLLQVKESAANSSTPTPPEVLHLYDIPEFQAGLLLASLATSAAFLLLFSTAGGALGGLLRSRRRARL